MFSQTNSAKDDLHFWRVLYRQSRFLWTCGLVWLFCSSKLPIGVNMSVLGCLSQHVSSAMSWWPLRGLLGTLIDNGWILNDSKCRYYRTYMLLQWTYTFITFVFASDKSWMLLLVLKREVTRNKHSPFVWVEQADWINRVDYFRIVYLSDFPIVCHL